jgi:hypothetical protein
MIKTKGLLFFGFKVVLEHKPSIFELSRYSQGLPPLIKTTQKSTR